MEGQAVIRPARVGDAPAIARVHVDSWRETYSVSGEEADGVGVRLARPEGE
ncbi:MULTISPECIES: hypothetical protein [unclassified Meiothermus]|uniref:hypothetical protein n=1 Tax=unclassified Meiothermus TaxID=370471 RepID=UPI00157FA384|nr:MULTISPECIES: hypothetical protein [unclassified Meiothermus]